MTEHLRVHTDELRTAASSHDERGQRWADIAANPVNDPDQLAATWGVIAHPTTESLRAHNAVRAAEATAIGQAHDGLADGLRRAADAYDSTDAGGADAVSGAGRLGQDAPPPEPQPWTGGEAARG
ncbi:hypothetical protein B7435_25965 [Mycolicibacterium peregrinum]|uniref:type VII secretion target n=1 Tax=Mycolicibacterium peregrinum TaxID=43304 RepID=UPI000B4A7E2C|nr:type VII secretion target [Mycolicibacterium peregrinum]OWL98122.1 hypothetical protein B7435_25965 [Mycolicibacterium peregrinum]